MPDSEEEVEEWRSVKGYEGLYEVSSLGRVRGLDRVIGGKGERRWKGRLLKLKPHKEGYVYVHLYHQGRQKVRLAHMLVAEAFLGRPQTDEYVEVNHIDTDKRNNRVGNLQYLTPAQNVAHAVAAGLVPAGKNHYAAKLTEEAVIAIRKRRASGERLKDIAADYGVSESVVCYVAKRQRWNSVKDSEEGSSETSA